MREPNAPFVDLGQHLKYMREQRSQSLAEVSGAVEIDEQELVRIEAGVARPEEDVLLLLMSHLGVRDQEAVHLWELADYDEDELPDQIRLDNTTPNGNKPTVMLLAIDMRTTYTDGVEIATNQAGVSLHFTQSVGQSQVMPVARVGMSYDQAAVLLKNLQTALLRAKYLKGPKLLPPASDFDLH